MNNADDPVSNCPICGSPILLDGFRKKGFLRGRKPSRGGPFYEHACSKCRTVLTLESVSGRASALSCKKQDGLLDFLFPRKHDNDSISPDEKTGDSRYNEEHSDSKHRVEDHQAESDIEIDENPGTERDSFEQKKARDETPPDLDRCSSILGIGAEATRAEVLMAFRKRAQLFHPDRFAMLDEDFRSLAHEKLIEMQEARDRLLAALDKDRKGETGVDKS